VLAPALEKFHEIFIDMQHDLSRFRTDLEKRFLVPVEKYINGDLHSAKEKAKRWRRADSEFELARGRLQILLEKLPVDPNKLFLVHSHYHLTKRREGKAFEEACDQVGDALWVLFFFLYFS